MIGNQEKQALADLTAIVSSLELPMILVGAGARLIIFDRKFGEGRSTKDWDIAVSIRDWREYDKLRKSLTTGDSPRFRTTQSLHKFIHIETDIEVDIVPFGKIGEPDQQIVWADSENPMNVWGFAEALLSAKTETIDDLEIQVIDTPAFIVLKIFAWGDRGERTNKDLEDIELILSRYEDDERVYEELAEGLASGAVDFLDATAYLLGQDIYRILRADTLLQFNLLLDQLINNLDSDEPSSLGDKLKILRNGIASLTG